MNRTETIRYEMYKVYFDDGTDTLLAVPEDEDVQDAAVRLADFTGGGEVVRIELDSEGVQHE